MGLGSCRAALKVRPGLFFNRDRFAAATSVARVIFERRKPKKASCAATRTRSTTVSSSSRALWTFEALVGAFKKSLAAP